MKVIKNKVTYGQYKEEQSIFPLKAVCEYCESEIELEEDDVEVGRLGLYKFICPCCNEESYIDESITLTKDNLEFPRHYYCFGNGVKQNDDYINSQVKKCIETLRNNKDGKYCMCGSGNTKIFVERYDGDEEYCVTVAKGYYETNVPFEDEDYN